MVQESLLNDLSEALTNREFEEAQDVLDELNEEYAGQRQDDQRLVNQSFALYSSSSSTTVEQGSTLIDTLRKTTSARLNRVVLIVSVSSFLSSVEELSDDERDEAITYIQSMIDELQVTEVEFEESVTQSRSVIEDSEIPPRVGFRSAELEQRTVDRGESTVVTVSIENAGESTARGVSVATGDGSVSVSPPERAIGELPAETETELSFEVYGDETGQRTLRLIADSENAGSDTITRHLKIRDTPAELTTYTNEEDVVDTEGLLEAVEDWRQGSIETSLLLDAIGYWRTGDPAE